MFPQKENKNDLANFFCEKCEFSSNKKFDYNRHLATSKHKTITDVYTKSVAPALRKYTCNCGKEYSYRQSLCVHRKNCTNKENEIVSEKDMLKNLLEESKQLKLIVHYLQEIVKINNLNIQTT